MSISNLVYRIERIFKGESGIVREVEVLNRRKTDKYDEGNLPQRVKFVNPLGEEISVLVQPRASARFNSCGQIYNVPFYKQYEIGDKYP